MRTKSIHPKFKDDQMIKLKTAADIIGCNSLTNFVSIAAMEKANRILNQNKTETLSKKARDLFSGWDKQEA